MNIIGVDVFPTDPLWYIEVSEDQGFKIGDKIILQGENGLEESGIVHQIYIEEKDIVDLKNQGIEFKSKEIVLRLATPNDLQKIENNQKRIEQAMIDCEKRIIENGLDMRLVTAYISFNSKNIMFVFVAENRVDFRNLVKDLARQFQKQVRLKQIGPRDRTKFFGGYGRCGRALCCSQFLKNLESVTMDMVRVQNMTSKGSSKISGVCGKLMCCLAYEVELYNELRDNLPMIDSIVKYKRKEGRVRSLDILNQMVKVNFGDLNEEYIAVEDLKVIKKENKWDKDRKDLINTDK